MKLNTNLLKIMKLNKERFKNPFFWLALIGIVYLLATNPNGAEQGKEMIEQYFDLISTLLIFSGIWVDPTTPGLKDEVYDDDEENIQE